MRHYRYTVDRSYVGGMSGTALVTDEEPLEELCREAVGAISTELQVTIGGVSMFLAAWEDPEHWSEDWAEKLGVGHDEVPEAVAGLISSAEEAE